MDRRFWHQKWTTKDIGFHQSNPNPLMTGNFNQLGLQEQSRVLLPLCGKTTDVGWLLANSYQVVGIELVESAVVELFFELGIKPQIINHDLKLYQAENLDIFVGDFFDLSQTHLGKVDAVYDRAALVALPETMRLQYAKHLAKVTLNASQLLISFDYDQSQMQGPPFSVDSAEIRKLYDASYKITLLAETEVIGGLKGKCHATENAWLLQPKD